MTDETTVKLFVYGTLRKGYNNHGFLKSSKFIGEYETGPGYRKVVSGLPYLFEDESGPGCSGELYEISLLTLQRIDRLEGHPEFYKRVLIKVFKPDKDIGTDCYAYIMPKERI